MTISPPSAKPAPPRRSSSSRTRRRIIVNWKLLGLSLLALAVVAPAGYGWYRRQVGQTADALLDVANERADNGEFREAARFYQRYLLLNPDDTETLLQLVHAVAESEADDAPSRGLIRLLYRAVGRAPERYDLRLMLADHLLHTGEFEQAIQVAAEVSSEAPEALEARRVTALAKYYQTQAGNPIELANALALLIEVNQQLPGNVELAKATANAARRSPDVWQAADFATAPAPAATAADQIMDRLVETADELGEEQVDARLGRFIYRQRHRLPDAESDLQQALKIDPENLEARLYAAQLAHETNPESDQAETQYREIIATEPGAPDAYYALARILAADGRADEAVELLLKGQEICGDSLKFAIAITTAQIAAKQYEAARAMFETDQGRDGPLTRRVKQDSPRLEKTERTELQNHLHLLKAQILVGEGQPNEAAAELEAIMFSAVVDPTLRQSFEWQQAALMLARQAGERDEWDIAAELWETLAETAPQSPELVQAAATALLKSGDVLGAIERLESHGDVSQMPEAMALQLAQAHLSRQLSRPADQQNWTELDRVLEQVRTQFDPSVGLLQIEVRRRLAVAGPEPSETPEAAEIVGLLEEGEAALADAAPYWRLAAATYAQLDRQTEAKAALDRYLSQETDPLPAAQAEVEFYVQQGDFDAAADVLTKKIAALPADERRPLLPLQVQVHLAAQQPEAAFQHAERLLADYPDHLELLELATGLAIDLGKPAEAKNWEQALEKQLGPTPRLRYLRAARIFNNYDELSVDERAKLNQLIAEVRSERPRWHPPVALAARLAQRDGDDDAALELYREAVDLGDRQPATITRFLLLLYETDQIREAEEYLARIDVEQANSAALDSLAINMAVRGNRLADALEMARQGVEQHPDEPLRYIGLANLLLQDNQTAEAAVVLRDAAGRFPDNAQIWNGLVSLFVKTGRAEDARAALTTLLGKESLDAASRHYIAAQGYEVLGDRQRALQHYQQTLQASPENTAARLRFAKLLRTGNIAAARQQYEAVLQQEPDNDGAKLELAALLGASGQDGDWQQAVALLDQARDSSQGNAETIDRLRAVLLARRGRTPEERLANIRTAQESLQTMVEAGGSENQLNRQYLVQTYEREAELTGDDEPLRAAQQELAKLVDAPNPTAEVLASYIEFLLRHATAAGPGGDGQASPTPETPSLREEFLAEAKRRLPDLQAAADASPTLSATTLATVELTARLLEADGEADAATEYVAQFINEQEQENLAAGSPQQLLTAGQLFTKLGRHAEAEQWYRRLMEQTPDAYVLVVSSLVAQDKRAEAAALCLEAADGEPTPQEAMVLASVLTTSGDLSGELSEALAALEEAARRHSDNVNLLQATAAVKASRGDYDAAIASYRRLIEIDPENTLALNNLATLLAERPNQLGEALDFAKRAITQAGRNPALLDTLGTIYLKMQDHDQAIAALEEATGSGARDPRYHFHLAAAYARAGRPDDAARSLQVARQLGLDRALLTADDRALLAELEQLATQAAAPTQGTY